MFLTVETVSVLGRIQDSDCTADLTITTTEQRNLRPTDVGSRGPGFDFVKQGQIWVVTPAP